MDRIFTRKIIADSSRMDYSVYSPVPIRIYSSIRKNDEVNKIFPRMFGGPEVIKSM